MTSTTVLATFHLQHQDPETLGFVDSPVTVVATDQGPGTPATFQVVRNGQVLSGEVTHFCPVDFPTAVEAMAFALDFCGWDNVTKHL